MASRVDEFARGLDCTECLTAKCKESAGVRSFHRRYSLGRLGPLPGESCRRPHFSVSRGFGQLPELVQVLFLRLAWFQLTIVRR